MSSIVAGLRLNHRYLLAECIGLGGMSEVWWADDELRGAPVAVKLLDRRVTCTPVQRAAIRREARAAARLTHPNVTQVYEYGEHRSAGGDLLPYLVMELLAGRTLAERLSDGPLAWPAAARIAGQVSAALASAHDLGIVHRDVKPGNVMLSPAGAKVLDFGIATLAGPAGEQDRWQDHWQDRGQDRWLTGTPTYAAPELVRDGRVGPAADVYAIGVLLYEALAGHPPLAISSWEQAIAVHDAGIAQPPPLPADVPPELSAACLACLCPDPTHRPTSRTIANTLGWYGSVAG